MMKKIAVVHCGNSDNNKVLSFVVCIPLKVHEKGTQKIFYWQHSNLVFHKFSVFVQAFLNKHHNICCHVFNLQAVLVDSLMNLDTKSPNQSVA